MRRYGLSQRMSATATTRAFDRFQTTSASETDGSPIPGGQVKLPAVGKVPLLLVAALLVLIAIPVALGGDEAGERLSFRFD